MGLKELLLLRLAKRWISGVDLDSALADAKKANSKGMGAVVNFLGEEIRDPAVAESHTGEYLRLQQRISDEHIRGFASVKLTQLGLGADDEGAFARLEKIADNSDRLGQALWIDMESSQFTEKTISMYLASLKKHRNVGIVLQAYMKRSEADLPKLLDAGARIRLVKGAYRERPDVVYHSKEEVAESFRRLMRSLFEEGTGFAIATHDSILIDEAKKLAETKRNQDFEFEMLKGIRDELKVDLVGSGFNVSEYLPYGDRWFAYSKRRITEHPSNIMLLLRSLV
ncbi:MAG TPA: proline dehydrogenase family protein [Nitrososphaerales archaeon]|nr:proline dehydrogenase family protein [Nitrososphaerales archaeon]